MSKKGEIILNTIWVIFSASLFVIAIPYADIKTLDPIGPHVFPKLMSVVIFICAIINLISVILKRETGIQQDKKINIKNIIQLVLVIIAGGFYIVIVPWLGYFFSTALLMIGLIEIQKEVKLWLNIFVSVSFSMFLYLVFSMILNILLPHGFLKFI
jgi:putative tricarboxylic transport membrane protein